MSDIRREQRPAAPAPARTTVVETAEVRKGDLVRWGAVMAGLFASLATLIGLGVLGLAIGLSTFDANDPNRAYGLGAGVWGAISALLAFLVGGWVAGRAAAYGGKTSGIMNGAMVWFVAIPLLIYLLGSGLGAVARTAGNVAGTAANVAGNVVGQAAQGAAANPALQATAQDPALQGTAVAGAEGAAAAAQATAQAALSQVTPTDVNNAAETAADGAWGTLLSLGLAAAAAIGGGYLGARPRDIVVSNRA